MPTAAAPHEGVFAYDPASGLQYKCYSCGQVVAVTLADLAKEFRAAAHQVGHYGLAIRNCPGCGCDHHLNCHLPPDHPHPSAKFIQRVVADLKRITNL